MKNKKNPACQAKAELMQEIESLQQALETAHSNFENVCDPDLICLLYTSPSPRDTR